MAISCCSDHRSVQHSFVVNFKTQRGCSLFLEIIGAVQRRGRLDAFTLAHTARNEVIKDYLNDNEAYLQCLA